MNKTFAQNKQQSRRQFLKLAGLGIAASSAPALLKPAEAAKIRSQARIVIVGAGAGGLAAASRLSNALKGASITIIDGKEAHHYQPGLTLVASGVWKPHKVISKNSRYIPADVRWIKAYVSDYDPDANRVITEDGQSIDYDYLVVAPGLQLDYEQIEGMESRLIGQHGITSVYAGPDAAAATWRGIQDFINNGGIGLFGRPTGDIKCAGAPLKITMLTHYRLQEAGRRQQATMIYNADSKALFGVPIINKEVLRLFAERDIDVNYDHVLTAIDPGRRQARYRTPTGEVTMDYDFIHVVPPMRAPDSLKASPLAWQEGPFASAGWLEVDKHTLQHRRYPNIFGIGDINGVPRGKTAASVKLQAPVAIHNLLSVLQGQEPSTRYNGYTSCPLITGVGSAMLVEFDYDGNLIPSFPFIDPLKEGWVPWLLKETLLQPAYQAVLRGTV